MSEISDLIYSILKKKFPLNIIKKEHYVNENGIKLYFDFYVKGLELLVEVQGRQHVEYTKHFHNDYEGYLAQKKRDNIKIAYVEANPPFALVRFYYNEKITEELVMDKVLKALEEGFYE